MYIKGALVVDSEDNSFSYCYVQDDGGFLTLIDTYMIDEVSVFEQNAAVKGGAINCDSC